jgi:hypothetical protein
MRSIFIGIGSRAARVINEILRNSRDPLSLGNLLPIDISTRKDEKPYEAEIEVTKEGTRDQPEEEGGRDTITTWLTLEPTAFT